MQINYQALVPLQAMGAQSIMWANQDFTIHVCASLPRTSANHTGLSRMEQQFHL